MIGKITDVFDKSTWPSTYQTCFPLCRKRRKAPARRKISKRKKSMILHCSSSQSLCLDTSAHSRQLLQSCFHSWRWCSNFLDHAKQSPKLCASLFIICFVWNSDGPRWKEALFRYRSSDCAGHAVEIEECYSEKQRLHDPAPQTR